MVEKNDNFALIALVAIVAVVGLVGMIILMQGGSSRSVAVPQAAFVTDSGELSDIYDSDGNLIGQAMWEGPAWWNERPIEPRGLDVSVDSMTLR